MTLIFAHRGSAGTHPENTMSAFKEAARVGADGIETDVQLSKDGEVVIIHDEKLDRTTNASGYVKDRTLMELKTLNASATHKGKLSKEKIPTLEELFIWLYDNQLFCNIELKNMLFLYPGFRRESHPAHPYIRNGGKGNPFFIQSLQFGQLPSIGT